jgi:ribosomal protein S18 acetylase RimI-like enzyme
MSRYHVLNFNRTRDISDETVVHLNPSAEGVVDRQSIFALYKLSLHEYVAQTFNWDESLQQERFNASYRDPDFISIELGSTTVGYIALKASVEDVHLSLLLLQPEYRNRGIGRKVMQTLMARAAETNLPLTLSCFLCNQGAMRFYQKLGFCLVRKDEHFADYRFPAA